MNLFKNLTNYNDSSLEIIGINGIHYKTRVDFTISGKPSVMIGQAFGGDEDKRSYNHNLALSVRDARDLFGKDIPAIVQEQIALNLKGLGIENFYEIGINWRQKLKETGHCINTPDVFDEVDEIIEKNNYDRKKVLFLAHPAHTQRVLNIARKRGLEGYPFIREKVEWPKDSFQCSVNGPRIWAVREICARIHHKMYGIT